MALTLKSAGVVWLLLMAITCASTWGLAGNLTAARFASTAIMLLAGFKVRLVLLYFMELRNAPRPWRWLFEGWVLTVTVAILACYLPISRPV